MTSKSTQDKPFNLLLFFGLIFVAVNLRAPITSVGPLVSTMKGELPFSSGVFGLLTTIPLIMFALYSKSHAVFNDGFLQALSHCFWKCPIQRRSSLL